MSGLLKLKREATEAAEWRGHDLDWAPPWHGERKSLQNATCRKCGMEVQINTRPDANGIDVGGEAVALNCPGKMVRENPARRAARNPALEGVYQMAPNMIVVQHGAASILHSYGTPVAVNVSGGPVYVTDKKWSNTTSRHISKWHATLGNASAKEVIVVSQAEIEKMAREGAAPRRNPTLAILGNPRRGAGSVDADTLLRAIESQGYDAGRFDAYAAPGTPRDYDAPPSVTAAAIRKAYDRGFLSGKAAGPLRNPGGRKKLARKVLVIDYVHASDGKKYTHDFGEDRDHGPVLAFVEDGGKRVILEAADGRAIVKDY